VAVADLTGDGKLDLVTANAASATVSVITGKGDGTFLAGRAFAAGSAAHFLGRADFNADGKQDLAVVNYGANTVSILLGNGNGTFQAPQALAVGTNPFSLTVADLNGDGKPDLAVPNSGSQDVSVLLGNGDGTFQVASSYTAGPGASSVGVADLNADGKPDLAVANAGSTTVSVLLGNGNGIFQSATSFPAGNGPIGPAMGDFNGDGKQDMAVADFGSNTLAVLLGNGDGTLQAPLTIVTGLNPHSVAAGFFNGDAVLDLAVANYSADTLAVLMGNGNGTFQPAVIYALSIQPVWVGPGDLNADGITDLVATNIGSTTASVLLGNGNGSFQPAVNYGAGGRPSCAAIGDYNGDGSQDLAVSNYDSGTVSVLLGAVSAPTVAIPVLSPTGGTYVTSVTVTISDSTPGATIHYTTDGSTPTTSSTPYTGPIAVTQTTTVKAMAAASGMLNSGVASATYAIQQQVATPALSPAGGTYMGSVTVTISDATPGATIHYTTDGSTPTTASATYAGPIAVTQTTTIKAMAAASGMADSAVASAAYTIQQQVATPSFSPAGGTYISSVTVTISDTTPGATIYYTTDGSTPTTNSTPYSGPIPVTQTRVVKAIASASGMFQSDVATAAYTIKVATPAFGLAGGTYNTPQTVTLGGSTSGAAIYYTTNGSTPTTASTLYTGPISVSQTTTVRAIGAKSGLLDSDVASATYTLQAATPTFNPPSGGTFILPLSVSISSSSPGVTIYYTTDGSTPTTASTQYTGPITVITTTTIKAIAVRAGWSQSPVASATYTHVLF